MIGKWNNAAYGVCMQPSGGAQLSGGARTVFAHTDGHTRRLKGWDYSKGASFFITLSTDPRRPVFGHVANGRMVHSALGEKVVAALESIPVLNPGISLYGNVVMPDHVHFNVHLAAGLKEPLKVLGNAVRRFKNHTLKVARVGEYCSPASTVCAQVRGGARTVFARLLQKGYHDHLCLNRRFIDSTERYIAYNPLKWELMHGSSACLRIIEPLDSPRLDPGEYWKGVGNVSMLGTDVKMVSLRVSRKVTSPEAIAQVVKRMVTAVEKGYVVISGFISGGEQAVRDMLCRMPMARFVRILPSCIPNALFKPESRYAASFAEGRYLEIAQGNDEVEFGRGACLDLNAEIIKIATAGNGLAVYWKADGPHVLARNDVTVPSEGVRTVFGHVAERNRYEAD